jgi:putative tryptophan/tyrosine transport system substrate-binding protein
MKVQRREFITVLAGAAAAWPRAARAQQQSAMPVVGYFHPGLPEPSADNTAAFRQGLGELGFVEGSNVAIEYRFAGNDASKIPEMMADLVRRRVAVIAATGGSDGARAAKAATATIPIVFETGGDPVEDGLVTSFNRPGGNATGVTAMNRDLHGKRLALLAEAVPKAARFGVMMSDFQNQGAIQSLPTISASLGRQLEALVVANTREIDEVFASLAEKRIDALYVTVDILLNNSRVQVATLAARYAMPTISGQRSFVDAGGLMSYGSPSGANYRLVGSYVGRILKGEKPADLPVVRPTRFEFAINLQTARLLRIELPPTLLAIADAVIE